MSVTSDVIILHGKFKFKLITSSYEAAMLQKGLSKRSRVLTIGIVKTFTSIDNRDCQHVHEY